MKNTWLTKNKYLFFILLSLSIQQLQSRHLQGDHFTENNNKSNLTDAAILAAIAYGAYHYYNKPILSPIPLASSTNIKSIIFDIDGVLSKTNKLRAFHEIGIPVTLSYMKNQMELPSEKILFDTLANVPANSTYKSYNKGLEMPQTMIDWQVGSQDLSLIRQSIMNHLKTVNLPTSQTNWALQSSLMMTDPERFISTRQIISENVKLLQELKDKGYKLYILSNWDPSSFPLFQRSFPEIFVTNDHKEMFDGIMISGNVKIVKPETAIFERCLEEFNLKAQDTIFIDDEPANVIAAQKIGITTILSDPHNTQALRTYLIAQLKS